MDEQQEIAPSFSRRANLAYALSGIGLTPRQLLWPVLLMLLRSATEICDVSRHPLTLQWCASARWESSCSQATQTR